MRPSKAFLFDHLERFLSGVTSGVGIDAAAGTLKNRPMFRTDLYVALDLQEGHLRNGLETYPGPDVVAVLADLTAMERFPVGAASVVVSTNTLLQIPPARRALAAENLVRITAPTGMLLCSMPLDSSTPAVADVLEKGFTSVRRIYYRNALSRAFERRSEHPDTGYYAAKSGLMQLPERLLTRLEYVTSPLRIACRAVFFVCTGHRSQDTEPFSLERFPRLADRFYDAR